MCVVVGFMKAIDIYGRETWSPEKSVEKLPEEERMRMWLGVRFGKILSGERKERIKDNYRVKCERETWREVRFESMRVGGR